MARSKKDYSVIKHGNYQLTDSYLQTNNPTRKQMDRYAKDLKLDPQHMYLLVRKHELDSVDEQEKKEAAFPGQMILLLVALAFAASMGAAGSLDASTILYEIIVMVAVIVAYFLGFMDKYRYACRRVQRLLKKYPSVPSFEEWASAHPQKSQQQVASHKAQKKGKHKKK